VWQAIPGSRMKQTRFVGFYITSMPFRFCNDGLDSGCIVSLGSAWIGGGCVKVTTHEAGEG
jgi:hypothetical protein